MSTNPGDLVREQYKTSANLNARIRLHSRFSTNRYGMFRWIFDRLQLPDNARVLELGSGTALLWTRNAGRIPPGWRITLSDFSLGMIDEVRTNIATIERPFALMQLDAQALPFEAGSFDGVIANHMLYHVPNIPRALSEIRRVLAPGAPCYAATFSRANMQEFNHLVRRFFGVAEVDRAATRFGLETGYDLMRECFGRVEVVRYPDSLVVNEAKPLMDYVNSTSVRRTASDEQESTLRSFIEAELAAHGSIRITKDAGILIATA